jgi:hypothetical protein
MNLSNESVNILKNFSTINPSVWVNEGNVLRTVSPAKTIMASAVVDDDFPTPFGIYDLNQFLGTVGLLENPDFDFKDTYVNISSGKSKVRYGYVDKSLITAAPDKDIDLPDTPLEFRLNNDDLQKVMRACNVLQLPNLAIRCDEGELKIVACDTKNPEANDFSIALGDCGSAANYVFRLENLKMMPNDYDVIISSQGISKFVSSTNNITYYIATESI